MENDSFGGETFSSIEKDYIAEFTNNIKEEAKSIFNEILRIKNSLEKYKDKEKYLNVLAKDTPETEEEEEVKSKGLSKDKDTKSQNPNTINLHLIRRLLSMNNNNYPSDLLKIITHYKLSECIKKGIFGNETFQNIEITQDDFVELLTGKLIKELLFDIQDPNTKRFNIENYIQLYELMGGDYNGLHVSNIKNCLEVGLNSVFEDLPDNFCSKEAKEIVEFLGKDDKLEMQDVVDAFLSNTPMLKDINHYIYGQNKKNDD